MVGETETDEQEAGEAIASGAIDISPDEPQKQEPGQQEPESFRDALAAKLKGEDTPEEPKPEVKEDPKPETAPAQPAYALAPADMTTDEKQAFENPTAENKHVIQGYIARRAYETRQHLSRKSMELGQREKAVSGIVSAIEPHRERFARMGRDPSKIVESALSWDAAFNEDPVGAAREYLEHWGVDPSELLDDSQESVSAPHPNQNGYNDERLTPEQVQEQINNALIQKEQSDRTAKVSTVIESFIAEKPILNGDPGTAMLFEQEMAPILKNYRTFYPSKSERELLDMAYDFTLSNSERFRPIKEQMDAHQNVERSKQEAAKAKQASRSISGGPGSGSPTRKYASFRENLEANLRK